MKDIIDLYEYQGNHYYYPHLITTSFALNYSKKTIADNALEDPFSIRTANGHGKNGAS